MEAASSTPSDGAQAIFVRQLAIYHRVVRADYMSHRTLFRILRDLLQSRREPFSFLDLASGDASCSVDALTGTRISDYTAVDLSEPALRLAMTNVGLLPCRTQTVLGDFQEYLNPPPRRWDVIFIGFSYHHLIGPAKLAFAQRLRTALGEGGEWTFFEPLLCEGQTRADYLERWQRSLEDDWKEFNAEEKAAIWDHVVRFDYPESCESFGEIAVKAGFRAFEHLYTDPFRFYGAFRALA